MSYLLAEQINSCAPLLHPTNGIVRMSGTVPGDTGVYFCRTGNVLSNVEIVTCLNNGTWSNVPPLCPMDGMDVYVLLDVSIINKSHS